MSPGRITSVVVAGLVVAGVVIAGAMALGGTSQLAPPDAAQPIVVGVVAAPGEELTGPTDLPPLAMVLDEPVPDAIAQMSASQQVAAYRVEAEGGDVAALMRLGAAQQRAGEHDAAAATFREAAAADPDAIAPVIGLALADAATGDAGMKRATAVLAQATRDNPESQLAWFNRGWLATYRRDGKDVIESWKRVVTIDQQTPIGQTAAELLKRIANQADSGGGTRTGGG